MRSLTKNRNNAGLRCRVLPIVRLIESDLEKIILYTVFGIELLELLTSLIIRALLISPDGTIPIWDYPVHEETVDADFLPPVFRRRVVIVFVNASSIEHQNLGARYRWRFRKNPSRYQKANDCN